MIIPSSKDMTKEWFEAMFNKNRTNLFGPVEWQKFVVQEITSSRFEECDFRLNLYTCDLDRHVSLTDFRYAMPFDGMLSYRDEYYLFRFFMKCSPLTSNDFEKLQNFFHMIESQKNMFKKFDYDYIHFVTILCGVPHTMLEKTTTDNVFCGDLQEFRKWWMDIHDQN